MVGGGGGATPGVGAGGVAGKRAGRPGVGRGGTGNDDGW